VIARSCWCNTLARRSLIGGQGIAGKDRIIFNHITMKTVYTSFSHVSFRKFLSMALVLMTLAGAQAQIEINYSRVATLGNDIGNAEGQFNQPSSIAFDKDDNAYVADQTNHRIQVFNTQGQLVRQFGTRGNNPGELNYPACVVVTPDQQHVYVGHDHGVEVFTRTGEFVRRVQTDNVYGISIEPHTPARVFLATTFKILVYSANFGQLLTTIGEYGHGDGQLDNCRDIVVDHNGHLFAADMMNQRIQVLGTDGGYIGQFKSSDQQNFYPSGVAVDGMGNVYIAEQGTRQVKVGYFDVPQGTWFKYGAFGPQGTNGSNFQSPIDITVTPSGMIGVADVQAHQVTLFKKQANEILNWEDFTKAFGDEDFSLQASNDKAPEYQVKFEKIVDPALTGEIVIDYTEQEDYVVRIIRAGQVRIRASVIDGITFGEAVKDIILTIDKAPQEITFAPLDIYVFGQAPFTVAATSTSGLPITFESNNTAIATVNGNTVTLKSPGILMIIARQEGNENYLPAYPIKQVLEIDAITGTAHEEHNSIRVYPIPAQDVLTINAPFTAVVTPVTVCDAWGRAVRQVTPEIVDAQTRRISLTGLAPGLYLLQLNDGKSASQRLIKN
jgi:DNA-binding beta-propeller fold protein YncE